MLWDWHSKFDGEGDSVEGCVVLVASMSVTAMFSTATHTILKGGGHDISLSESIHRN